MEEEKGADFWKAQYFQLEQLMEMELAEKEVRLKTLEEELTKVRQELEAKNMEATGLKTQLGLRDGMIDKLREIARSGTNVIREMQETERSLRGEIENLQIICALQQSESDMTQNVNQQGGAVLTEPVGVGMLYFGTDHEVDLEALLVEEVKELGYDEDEMASYIEASRVKPDQEIPVGDSSKASVVNPVILPVMSSQEELVEFNPLETLHERTHPAPTGSVAPAATVVGRENKGGSSNRPPIEHSRDMAKPKSFTCNCGETFKSIGGLQKHIGRYNGNPY